MEDEVASPIDIWDLNTFDPELMALLKANEALIRDYAEEETRILALDGQRPDPSMEWPPSNPHEGGYHRLEKLLADAMAQRSIRAFHYTRLTESEIQNLRNEGIHLSTQNSLKERLAGQVAEGAFSDEIASLLYDLSPLLNGQEDNRSGMFWLSALPVTVDDRGVERLLSHWGGEVVYMWLEDQSLIKLVQSIGQSYVIEVCVPMSSTTCTYIAGLVVIGTFVRSLGLRPEHTSLDVCITSNLPPNVILNIHTEGDELFRSLGRSYPASYRK